MEIKLDDLNFQEIFSAAILKELTDEKRAVIIQESIKYLMTPDRNSYSKSETPLQYAFRNAMRTVAEDECVKILSEDKTVTENIQGLIRDAVNKIFTDGRDATVGKIADKIIEGLTSRY